MSNAIARVVVQAAERVGRAIEDAAKSAGTFYRETGNRLETAVRGHVEHDGSAAAELEKAGRHADETPTVHGAGGRSTDPAAAPSSSTPAAGSDLERAAQFGPKVQRGFEEKSTDPRTSGQFPPGYQPMNGMTPEEYLAKYSDGTYDRFGNPSWKWDEQAPNNGVLGTERPTQVEVGTVIDRYGGPHGRFLSPDGTQYPQRGLPAQNLADDYHRYRVVQPLPANEGIIAPAFGEPGLGTQFRLEHPVSWYLDDQHKYLEEITE